ncbi:hypothetical protein ACIA6T_06395 [Streptomyces sp. NPDC051740]|uniref:hypothetical protein n=1 Tax=Streptomyces sp. NPDC051740 TaxID=3365673 RepID=UPI0037BB264B
MPYLAVPALHEALRPAPASSSVLREPVSAYEDEGDGRTPADPAERLTDFVSAVRGTRLRDDRYRLRSSGPVAGSRFL